MGLLKAVIWFILLNIVIFGSWFFYENYLSGEIQNFGIAGYNPNIQADLINVSGDVKQFYSNMRFNHNQISYYINANCEWYQKARMKEAFEIINQETNGLISFKLDSESVADILVGCSADSYEKEENIFVAGEGGPTRIINSSMPVITKGKVLLYNESRVVCDEPLLELHELFHVFGYDHINNSKDLMYPYLDCDKEINPDLISHLIQLYSIEPFAELYFDEVTGNKERSGGKWYLNFNASINNDGIIDAENVKLEVYSQDKLMKSFGLDEINFGGGQNFYVKNLLLSPQSASSVELKITTGTKESNLENNILKLEI